MASWNRSRDVRSHRDSSAGTWRPFLPSPTPPPSPQPYRDTPASGMTYYQCGPAHGVGTPFQATMLPQSYDLCYDVCTANWPLLNVAPGSATASMGYGNFAPVPLWEREFCTSACNISWERFCEHKPLTIFFPKIMDWDDSGARENLEAAKERFRANYLGKHCDDPLLDPGMYIDKVDHLCKVDPELVADLDNISLPDNKSNTVGGVQTNLAPTGWGEPANLNLTGWGEPDNLTHTGWGEPANLTPTGWGEPDNLTHTGWGEPDNLTHTGWGELDNLTHTGWGEPANLKPTGWGEPANLKPTGLGEPSNLKPTGWGEPANLKPTYLGEPANLKPTGLGEPANLKPTGRGEAVKLTIWGAQYSSKPGNSNYSRDARQGNPIWSGWSKDGRLIPTNRSSNFPGGGGSSSSRQQQQADPGHTSSGTGRRQNEGGSGKQRNQDEGQQQQQRSEKKGLQRWRKMEWRPVRRSKRDPQDDPGARA